MKTLLTILGATLCITAFAQKPNVNKAKIDYEYYYDKGVASYEAEDFEAAADNFEKAYSIKPTDGLSMLKAGYASLQIDDNKRAKMNFTKASENGIKYLDVYLKPCELLSPMGIAATYSEITIPVVPQPIFSDALTLR